MEIIFLVIASFIGGRFETLEIRNYSEFSQSQRSCEDYIRSADFKKTLNQKPRDKRSYRIACTTASQLSGLENIITQASAWKEISFAEPVLLKGKITSDPEAGRRKSAQSYLGMDLTITTAKGRFALYSSESVSEEKLRALNGKTVKLRARLEDHTPAANAIEQYPTEMDGRPMKRTGYRVLAIE